MNPAYVQGGVFIALTVQRAEPGVERAVAVAVALCLPAVATFIAASAD